MQKLLTYHGRPNHILEIPGFFAIAGGQSHEIDDHMAEAIVRANPDLDIEITDLPAESGHKRPKKSQPEAREGEGQPTAPDQQEE